MDFSQFYSILIENILNTTYLEIIAVFFGLLSVWFAKQVNILVFPTGIISVVIYMYICFGAKLYADAGINFVYFVMSVYGWYTWTRVSEQKKERPISMCSKKEHLINIFMFVFFFIILSYVLRNYTDSTVPIWDSLTTSVFIVAMWLMAIKKVENWIAWIIGDVISIPLYFYKGLVLTSFQFTVFLIIAVFGYLEWRKQFKESVLQQI